LPLLADELRRVVRFYGNGQFDAAGNRFNWYFRETYPSANNCAASFFHCCIFADNFTSLSTVQSYLCGD
jgi:hypothetical protein